MPNSSLAIADFFIRKASDKGVELRPMKLLKLVYLAHGWNLGFTGVALISDEVQAWQWGPVIPSLYHEIKQFRDRPIPADVISASLIQPDAVSPLLGKIWDGYSRFSGAQLSTITHEEGSPWFTVWHLHGGKNRLGAVIPNTLIEQYYKQRIANARPSGTSAS